MNPEPQQTDLVTGDICDNCGQDFGLSGDDGDGAWNSKCVHCGSRYYTTEEEVDHDA